MNDRQRSDQLNDAVRAIGDHALQINLNRTAQVARALDSALGGTLADAEWKAAERQAHQLVGSAGTFGFPRASELAHRLEQFFAAGADQSPEGFTQAREDVCALQTTLLSEPVYQPDEDDR